MNKEKKEALILIISRGLNLFLLMILIFMFSRFQIMLRKISINTISVDNLIVAIWIFPIILGGIFFLLFNLLSSGIDIKRLYKKK